MTETRPGETGRIGRKARSRTGGFALICLGVALLLAGVISPWASKSPDGLERVAKDKGFMDRAEGREPSWKSAPMPDYAVPGVKSEAGSTRLAGLIGTVGVFLSASGIGLVIKKRGTETRAQGK